MLIIKKLILKKGIVFFCKIEFEITEPRYRNRKYCSQSCAAKYSNSKRTGCKYNSRDTFRLSLLKEHGHQCMVKDCYYKHFVDAHHIEKKSKGGSNDAIKNGILLCPNHHREADAGVLTPEKLHEYKSEFCSNGLRV